MTEYTHNKTILFILFALSSQLVGQVSNPTIIPSSPPGSCSSAVPLWSVYSTGILYICDNGTPTAIGAPAGTLTGTLTSGDYPIATGANTLGNSTLSTSNGTDTDTNNLASTGLTVNSVANVGTPTSTGATSGGTVGVSTTNFAYIDCYDSSGVNTTQPVNKSANVATITANQTIPWAWTAVAGCGTYRVWVATSGTPSHYFTSSTNSYNQTLPASSGTSGTFPANNTTGLVNGVGITAGKITGGYNQNFSVGPSGNNYLLLGFQSAGVLINQANLFQANTNLFSFVQNSSNTTTTPTVVFNGGGSLQNGSSGNQVFMSITSAYLQTGTAGGTDLLVNRTETSLGSGAQLLEDLQVGGVSKFNVDRTGITRGFLFSAAGTALPPCNSGNNGAQAIVSDATAPLYMTAYTSGGSVTAAVICSYNGSAYSWLTH